MSLSIRDQISSLGADLQRVAQNPSPSAIEELEVRIASIQSHVSDSDTATLFQYSERIQKLKGSDVTQLRSSTKSTTGSTPPKSPQKVYSVQDLKRTFDALVKNAETGKLKIDHALMFQDILLSSKSAHRDDPTMDAMEVGTEVLVTVAFESSAKIGSGPQIRSSAFTLNDQHYHVNLTRGDGACAIHALLGTRQASGVYQFNGNPRKHFTDNLTAALKGPGNAAVKQSFTEAMSNHFTQANRDRSSRMLFAGSVAGRALKTEWDRFHQDANRAVDAAKTLEAQLWLPLAETNHNGVMDAVMVEVNAENDRLGAASRYHGMNRGQVLLLLQGNPDLLRDIISTNQAPFLSKIGGHDNAEGILAAREAQQQALTGLEVAERQFIHSDRVVNHYVTVANRGEYYFNTAEIHVGALLFNKRVQVVGTQPIVPTEFPFNPGGAGELIVIHHRGAHFSRCVLDDGRGAAPVRREEGKRQEPQTKPSPAVVSVPQRHSTSKPFGVEIRELVDLAQKLERRKDVTREELTAFNEQLRALKEKADSKFDGIFADLNIFARSLNRNIQKREALERTAEATNTTTNSIWNLWGYWK